MSDNRPRLATALDKLKERPGDYLDDAELSRCDKYDLDKLVPIRTSGKGYDFLGLTLSTRSRRMRDKSVQKFKAKVRELTVRKRNLDAKVIARLNRVIRGTSNYFAARFSTCRWMFQELDLWIRMRLRCMKLKRKSYNDNKKL